MDRPRCTPRIILREALRRVVSDRISGIVSSGREARARAAAYGRSPGRSSRAAVRCRVWSRVGRSAFGWRAVAARMWLRVQLVRSSSGMAARVRASARGESATALRTKLYGLPARA
ncbi:hypothetical protein Axi01nite_54690 [Actinoplanes xinjiangensis]|nr:hypothetical protein Axi01nite_54690 [Actinoplanes xinjiangensis]